MVDGSDRQPVVCRSVSVSKRLAPFGVTIFTEMTELARRHDAVNLGQGFPNWEGADFVKVAAVQSIQAGDRDQYPPSPGLPELRDALAAFYGPLLGRTIDADDEVTVTSGCTEALAASMLGLIDPGDEVIVFEPFYDAYPADVAMAGGVLRTVTLRPPDFTLDIDLVRDVVSPRTKAIIVNNPHNPTGKVFDAPELAALAEICREHDVIAICDEVYEHMTYGVPHLRLASYEGMWERTLTLSSLGKTFSLTGWKLGWAIGPPHLTAGLRSAHQFLTFTTPTPVQIGGIAAMTASEDFYTEMRRSYVAKRDLLATGLESVGFDVHLPQGTYFLMASHPAASDDRAFCRRMAEEAGVVAIPPSVFYGDPREGSGLVRFAFCKDEKTLSEALDRLEGFT